MACTESDVCCLGGIRRKEGCIACSRGGISCSETRSGGALGCSRLVEIRLLQSRVVVDDGPELLVLPR